VRRAQAAATVGAEALDNLGGVVTVIVATRIPLARIRRPKTVRAWRPRSANLGAFPSQVLLGLEVVMDTPADPEDSLTETDLMTTYAELRSL